MTSWIVTKGGPRFGEKEHELILKCETRRVNRLQVTKESGQLKCIWLTHLELKTEERAADVDGREAMDSDKAP